MILLKNLAVWGILKRCMGSRKAISSRNLTFNRYPQFRNFYTCLEKCHSTQWEKSVEKGVERRFCTHSNETDKDSMEDFLGEAEEDEHPYEGDLTSEMFEEIAAGDPEILKRLKLLELEAAVLREEECRVPDRLSKSDWLELLKLSTLTKRKKFLAFLRLNELKRISSKKRAECQREMFLKFKEEQGFHYYGLSGHTMFMRVYEKDINRLLLHRSLSSKLHIVLDCSYQEYMSVLNLKACAKQIAYCMSEARLHRTSSQLKFCNLNREDALGQILPKYVASIYENFYYDIHSESYLDLYPKEKLVYLSPHAKNSMRDFNYDDVYIIGAYVDKGTGVKASLAKAKEHDLRMVKFPIDEYLVWKQGTKSLPLNVVINILLDMAFYNDWNRAFKSIPTRCLTEY